MKKQLANMKIGENGVVTYITPSLEARINGLGIRTSKTLTVAAKNPAKGPIVVTIDNNTISLGRNLCSEIQIEV